MLIRHVLAYLLAKGLPGLVNFAALALYTRLLSASDFGRYSSILAGVGLVHVIVFQWLLLVLGRFLPANSLTPPLVLQSLLSLFLALASLVAVVGAFASWLFVGVELRPLVAFAIALSISQAWHELNLRVASAKLDPRRYGLLSACKTVVALAVGALLAFLGFGASSPISGLIVGSVASCLFFASSEWKGIRPKWPDVEELRQYVAYGFPLAITFALVWITSSSDRLIISWIIDESATGVYAVGYDLAQQSLGLLLIIVNTASMPLAIKKMEQEGAAAAGRQMAHNGQLILVFALSGAGVLVATGPALIEAFVGKSFRHGALTIFPWVALLAAIVGIKSFHFDLAFHLAKKSKFLIFTSGVAAILNVLLNLALIPKFGILGAAWSGLIAYSGAAVCSAILGARIFPMPPLWPLLRTSLAVSVFSSFGAWLAMQIQAPMSLKILAALVVGGAFFSFSAILFDVAGTRKLVFKSIK